MNTSSPQQKNDVISFAFGKLFAVVMLAIGLLAVAKNTGIVSVFGFVEMVISGYQSIIGFFLSPLTWIDLPGFEVTIIEESAISLVMIILAGLTAWVRQRTIRWSLFSSAALITILVFGFEIHDLDGPALLGIAMLVPLTPILLLTLIYVGLNYRFPFGLPLLRPFKKWLQVQVNSIDFRGLVTLTVYDDGIIFEFAKSLITIRMILEYLATVAAALFIILSLFLAGFVGLASG